MEDVETIYNRIWSLDNEILNIFNNTNVEVDNEKQVISSAIACKVFEGCRASLTLLQNGFIIESTYILKEVTEALMVLDCIAKDAANTIDRLNINFNKRLRKKVNGKINKNDETKISEWSDLANMKEWYTVVYNDLCAHSHTNLCSLADYFTYDKKNKIIAFQSSWDDKKNGQLITIEEILKKALQDIKKILRKIELN